MAAPPRRAAFTLVELLVVVGIVALLIALLLPALGGALPSAITPDLLNALGREMRWPALDAPTPVGHLLPPVARPITPARGRAAAPRRQPRPARLRRYPSTPLP